MGRGKAAVLLLVGATVLGAEAHNQATKFSSDRIWQRQAPVIERTLRSRPEAKQAKFEELRRSLRRHEDSTGQEKCVFETNFEALLRTDNDQEEADRLITRRSFRPYANCEPEARIKDSASKWYSLAGGAAFLIGLYGMISSFFRRKEGVEPSSG